MKLIIAVVLALVLTGCASNSMPSGVYGSPFIIIKQEDKKPAEPAPVEESR